MCLLLAEAVEPVLDVTVDRTKDGRSVLGTGGLGVFARFLAGYFASRPTHNLVGADRRFPPF